MQYPKFSASLTIAQGHPVHGLVKGDAPDVAEPSCPVLDLHLSYTALKGFANTNVASNLKQAVSPGIACAHYS